MDILYVVGVFPKISESFVINEIHELKKRGHDVSVFSIEEPEERVTHEEIQKMNLSIHYAEIPSYKSFPDLFSSRIINTNILREAFFIDKLQYHAYCLLLGSQIIEAIEAKDNIDLIHAHFAEPNRLAASYAATYHDIPCTITAHAYEIFSPPSLPRLQRVCSRFDHIVVPSKYNQRYLFEEIGVDTDISIVPATTSVNKFEPSKGEISGRLLTVARLTEKKGHEYAIDAIAELVDDGYDVEYHIVGTGKRESVLREYVRAQGIEDRVKFLGHVSDEQLIDELHEAAIFVLPCVITADGNRDITPVALREAMATQTACVSTTISAIPEVITDGHDGILVKPNNSTELAHAVGELLDNPLKRQEIAKNGRQTVKTKFDISTAVDNLLDVFQTVQRKY